jgi:peptidoglycan/LPS O-acetylase OafA/YrhL
LFAAVTTLPTIPQAFTSAKVVLTATLGALLCLRLHGAERPNPAIVNAVTRRLGVVSFSIYLAYPVVTHTH